MRIAVHLDHSRLLRWHLALITSLQQAGHHVVVEFRTRGEPLPLALAVLLDFDEVRSGYSRDSLAARITRSSILEHTAERAGEADLTIDASASGSAAPERLNGRTLRPLYDGSAPDEALFVALLEGRAPQLAVDDSDDAVDSSGIWPIGLPALERPTRLATSIENVTSRLIEALVLIVSRIANGEIAPQASRATTNETDPQLTSELRFLGRRFGAKLARVRDRVRGDRPRWHVGWRRIADDASVCPGRLSIGDFRVLRDDGKRFYADPFVLERDGCVHVFVEELPDATGIGVISHFELNANGESTYPEPVLSSGTHLSYPFVFERDGETWMMPEHSAASGLDLYRCRRFPDQWEHEARLLDGRFHDATLFEHDGALWIAAATDTLQSSSWDALSIFHAPKLRGPWQPHARNPVLVDAAGARPAGSLFVKNGQLIRPVQDCTGGYGSRLRLRRIVRLTRREFAEEDLGSLSFGNGCQALGPHTLSRGGGFEVIDFYARRTDLRKN